MRRYNVVVATDIGTMIVNKNDLGVGLQLFELGTFDPQELNLLQQIARILRQSRPDLTVLDVGANIGVHSVVLAPEVGPRGKIYAFEAQRIIFNMLAGNIAINSIENVYCHHLAVSDGPGFIDIPQFDYGRPLSFGSVEFGSVQTQGIGQARMYDPERQEKVACIALDSLEVEHVDLMKVDVEGMELPVLNGARGIITRCKPVMLVEWYKGDREGLKQWLKEAGYRVFVLGGNFIALPQGSAIALVGLAEE